MIPGEATLDWRVVQISKVRMNPYVRLLQQALQERGVSCSTSEGLSPRLVRSWRGAASVLHVHWLELLYSSPSLAGSLRLLTAVTAGLLWARATGCRIVYTVHNLSPHEQAYPFLDRIANRVLLALADVLHVHDEQAGVSLTQILGSRKRIHVVPHGSYIGAYPNDCTKGEARRWLGLSANAFVYLFLGQIRRYKGIEDLVAAFGRLAGDACQLVIAGNVHDPAYAQSLAQTARESTGIHIWFQYVPDSEVQYFMNGCDVCVLPYHSVTTSGAAVLAFSFGRPIVAPALGGFPELAAGGRGIVYDPLGEDAILQALQEARSADMGGAGQIALEWAEEHQWRALAPRFVDIYEEALRARG